jgi:hypothetical protein
MNDTKHVASIGVGRSGARWKSLAFLSLAALFTGACSIEEGTESEEDLADSELKFGGAETATFRNGSGPSASYAGTVDATLRQGAAETNYGGAATCEMDGNDAGSDKSCLVKWALAGIQAGSKVQSASLTFHILNGSGDTYTIYDGLRGWNESQVTWNKATSSSPWATSGARGATDRGSSVGTITGSEGSRTVTLNAAGISMVQRWVNGGVNAGVIMANPSAIDGIDIASSENGTVSYRPALTVTYLPPDSGGYPKNTGGGVIQSAQGSFPWSTANVRYTSKGSVIFPNPGTSIGTVSTPAKTNDFEIVAFGASHGGDASVEVNTYFDSTKMVNQGFKAIGVRGQKDKKIELWIRKNGGQTTIDTPSEARSYNVLVIDGRDISLNLGAIKKNDIDRSGASWDVPGKSGSDFNVLAYFGDDSVEVTNTGGGELVFNQWGFGDGDSLNVMFYAPGDAPPSTILINNHAPAGRQYVGILANFPKN